MLKKNIFARFGNPMALISDGGSHFYNHMIKSLLKRYGVIHKIATPYHPQTTGQVKVSNRELKWILERIVSALRNDWALKIDDASWAYRTTFKTPISLTPYQLIYRKSCHLSVELEHKSYRAVKALNFDLMKVGQKRLL